MELKILSKDDQEALAKAEAKRQRIKNRNKTVSLKTMMNKLPVDRKDAVERRAEELIAAEKYK